MERKINKKFKPITTKIYKYRGQYVGEKPRGTILKYWIYDSKEKEYIGILRDPYWFLEIMSIVLIILSYVYSRLYYYSPAGINIPEVMYCTDNKLEINISNNTSYCLEVNIDSNVYGEVNVVLNPNDSIGTVNVNFSESIVGAVPFDVKVKRQTDMGSMDVGSKEVLIMIVKNSKS